MPSGTCPVGRLPPHVEGFQAECDQRVQREGFGRKPLAEPEILDRRVQFLGNADLQTNGGGAWFWHDRTLSRAGDFVSKILI